MDHKILVDRRIDDGMKLIAEMVRDGFDVTVAFWVKTREDGLWFLYLGSNSVDSKTNLGDSYRRLYASLSKISEPSIFLSDVKLVNSANPIALAAIKARDRLAGRMPIRSRAQLLGGLAVEEIYIYPQIGSMTPNEVMQTVIDRMSRHPGSQPSQVTLRDGSTVVAVPYGIKTVNNALQIDLLDTAGMNRSFPLDEISSIQ